MLTHKILIILLIFLITGFVFQGIYAHNNNLVGFHQRLIDGFAHAWVYKSGPTTFTASASCTAEAWGSRIPNEMQSGWYAILATAADDPMAVGDPGDFASELFVNDVYDWVGDSKDQENTPTDLWASASGMGEVNYYRKVIVDPNNPDPNRRWRWVILFHQHGVDGDRWEDYANEDDVQQ